MHSQPENYQDKLFIHRVYKCYAKPVAPFVLEMRSPEKTADSEGDDDDDAVGDDILAELENVLESAENDIKVEQEKAASAKAAVKA